MQIGRYLSIQSLKTKVKWVLAKNCRKESNLLKRDKFAKKLILRAINNYFPKLPVNSFMIK